MNLEEAFLEFTQSEEYREKAKQNNAEGSKYRTWFYRFNNGQLKPGGITEILLANGYEVSANKAVKKKTSKAK